MSFLDARVPRALDSLRDVPVRDPKVATDRRAAFLVEAAQLPQPVSAPMNGRLTEWMAAFTKFLAAPRKEKRPMFNIVMTLLLVMGILFGSGGAALAAAQSSLPDEALYPLKTWGEDARLQWADTEQSRLSLMLEYQDRRMEELRVMLQSGQTPPEAALIRTQNQMEYALRLAASLPGDEAAPALLQVQNRLQLHLQMMTQLRLPDDAAPTLIQARERIRAILTERIQLTGQGTEDLTWLREQLRAREQQNLQQQPGFQNQYQNQEQYHLQDCLPPECPQYQYQHQNQNGADEPIESLNSAGGNPWAVGTPTPGSSYGPGESQNPWTDTTPTPGSGYGPGPGPDFTCTPQPGSGSGGSPSPQPGGGIGGKP